MKSFATAQIEYVEKPSMIYYGIDPGLSGAIACLNGKSVSVQAIPLVKSTKGRNAFDLQAIYRAMWDCELGLECFAMIERQQPMPLKQGGTIANFNRGQAVLFEMSCVAHGLPYELVTPKTWQKAMLAGIPGDDTKQRSIIAAKRLFPSVSLKRTERSRTDDDGFSDALLLAEYGRRKHQGTLSHEEPGMQRV